MRSQRPDRPVSRHLDYVAPLALAVLGASAYLLVSLNEGALGFPLDDAWIHQTYARNLGQYGRWDFVPGSASAGSTSPLWTLLLAAGYLLRAPHLVWTYLLGVVCLAWVVVAAMTLWQLLWPEQSSRFKIAGLVIALLWPLQWASLSGMESLLFLALGLSALVGLYAQTHRFFLGVLSALLVAVRPEGLLLVMILAFALAVRTKWRALLYFAAGVLLTLLPYFALNVALGGELWPNTLYAKQAEHAALLSEPLPGRFLRLLWFSLGGPAAGWRGMTGPHLLLAPGLLLAAAVSARRDWQRRQLWQVLPLLWACAHVMAFALRLPVTYQHGRYLWAALPVWTLFGMAGWGVLLDNLGRGSAGRIGRRVAVASFAVILLLFTVLGAGAYAQDVAFVEGEMVDTALWLRRNTPQDALIAAHDIGAIGYFAQRPLLDLAGLITADVVPLLNDEAELAGYIMQRGADYLVTAVGWPYDGLRGELEASYRYDTDFAWTREQGWNNMTVYELR